MNTFSRCMRIFIQNGLVVIQWFLGMGDSTFEMFTQNVLTANIISCNLKICFKMKKHKCCWSWSEFSSYIRIYSLLEHFVYASQKCYRPFPKITGAQEGHFGWKFSCCVKMYSLSECLISKFKSTITDWEWRSTNVIDLDANFQVTVEYTHW